MSRTYRKPTKWSLKIKKISESSEIKVDSGFKRVWEGFDHHKGRLTINGKTLTGASLNRFKRQSRKKDRREYKYGDDLND